MSKKPEKKVKKEMGHRDEDSEVIQINFDLIYLFLGNE
jgi:hypothetical protein